MSVQSSEREPIEFEATLRVVAREPGRVLDRIAALRELAGFALEPTGERELHDVYLDLCGGRLRAARSALRLRRVGGSAEPGVLTLKSGGRAHGLAVERAELERPFAAGATAWLVESLRALGIELPGAAAAGAAAAEALEPIAALHALGLEAVQERTTLRRTLAVRTARGGEPLAEIALDRVAYRVAGRTLLHHEVEIEAASRAAREAVLELARALAGAAALALEPWPWSKLALGRALAELAAAGLAPDWIDAQGVGSPALYAALAARLSEGR